MSRCEQGCEGHIWDTAHADQIKPTASEDKSKDFDVFSEDWDKAYMDYMRNATVHKHTENMRNACKLE